MAVDAKPAGPSPPPPPDDDAAAAGAAAGAALPACFLAASVSAPNFWRERHVALLNMGGGVRERSRRGAVRGWKR